MVGRGLVAGGLAWLVAGCVDVPLVVHPGADGSAMIDVATLRDGTLSTGTMLVGPLRMTTGLAEDHLTAFAQDPVTGLGVELLMGEALDGWPPPIGTPLKVRGYYAGPAEAPVVWISAMKDVTVLGEPEPLTILDGLDLPPALSLAQWEEVTVETMPDPGGRAELSVRRLTDGRFGRFVPDLGNYGAITGIVLEDGSVAPRAEDDWVGSRRQFTVPSATLDEVLGGAVEPGSYVRIRARQITPWSVGGRYTVIQDVLGQGLWVDAEGWSPWDAQAGHAAEFTGQVEVSAGTWRLRAWTAPVWEAEDVEPPHVSAARDHGDWVSLVVSGIQAADGRGDRRVDAAVVLDDRFQTLGAIEDGWTVQGVVDLTLGDPRLAVVEATPPPPP